MTASFTPPTFLDWPNCLNVRDVGGLPTADGGRIRERALVRADSLARLSTEGVEAFRAYGVSRVIDLRRERERVGAARNPFEGEPIYRSISVQDPADPDHQWLSLAEIYQTMLDLRPALFTSAVAAVADAPAGAVVVHCAGGKDRTGLVTAMALAVAGVSDEVIAADYALTEARLRADNEAHLATITDPERRATAKRLQPTPPENMLRVLEHLAQKYDGVEGYLRHGGMSDERLEALRARLVEDGAA